MNGRLGPPYRVVYVPGGARTALGDLKECFPPWGAIRSVLSIKTFGVAAKYDIYDQSNIRKGLPAIRANEVIAPALDSPVYQSADRCSPIRERRRGDPEICDRRRYTLYARRRSM